jgi:trk system potassium uptake protein
VLIVGGWLAFAVLEWRLTLGHLAPWDRVANALFLSVTPRTAGFNTIDYGAASESTNFLTILLMSIGGSPGSTAGGLKTTTVALIGLLAWSRFRGRAITSLWDRSVPEETLQRAVGLFVVGFGAITVAILLFTLTEIDRVPHDVIGGAFLVHMFEATSAFNTVGLSMGATPELSPFGRLVTTLLMFVGRVGPLTFAAAIALSRPTARDDFRYAYEDVVVG